MSERKQGTAARLIASTSAAVLLGSAAVAVTAAPAVAGNCGYVANEAVQVRENPSINSVVRKTKPAGSYMTGNATFCNPVQGTDGRYWYSVETNSATDGEGWVIWNKVTRTTST